MCVIFITVCCLCVGTEGLGEVASLAVERMLALGRSVSHLALERRPCDDGVTWGASPSAIALQLTTQVTI